VGVAYAGQLAAHDLHTQAPKGSEGDFVGGLLFTPSPVSVAHSQMPKRKGKGRDDGSWCGMRAWLASLSLGVHQNLRRGKPSSSRWPSPRASGPLGQWPEEEKKRKKGKTGKPSTRQVRPGWSTPPARW